MNDITSEVQNEQEQGTVNNNDLIDSHDISHSGNLELHGQGGELLSPQDEMSKNQSKTDTPTKRHFSYAEDCLVRRLVEEHGTGQWALIAKQLDNRTPRQVRDRWRYYLDPQLVHNEWKIQDDKLLISLIQTIGKQWSQLVKFFPGRTDVSLKNHWNKLQRRAKKLNPSGIQIDSPDQAELLQNPEQNLLASQSMGASCIDTQQQQEMKQDNDSLNQN